jgi:hypothetical protein
MKKTFSLYLLFACLFSLAQQRGDVSINWQPTKAVSYGDFEVMMPQFDLKNFQFKTDTGQIIYNLKIPQSTSVSESSLQISNVVYESISVADLGELETKSIPSAINAKLSNSKSRDKHIAVLSFFPIIKDGSGYRKVKSLSYSFSSGTARLTSGNNNFNVISNSVLSTGEWYRFYVVKSGVYILNKTFLQSLGINTAITDPRKIKIYGNGGRMIPLRNDVYYPEDLAENAIQVIGEGDGVFNDSDSVIFYAEGVDNYNKDSDTFNNLYADKSYYYINVQGQDGKRMAPMSEPTGATTLTINNFNESQYHEVDLVNIGRLGRRWFGEDFDINSEQSFGFNMPGINTAVPVKLRIIAGGTSSVPTTFSVKVNNTDIGNMTIPKLGKFDAARADSLTSNNITAAENMVVKLTYNNNGVPSSKAYLDLIQLRYERALKGYGKQFRFQYNAAATGIGIAEYQIPNASGINQIWDITDIYNATHTPTNTQSNIAFKANLGELRKYVAVALNDLYTPLKEAQTRVFNQNLKGNIFKDAQGNFADIDYIIVAPYAFVPQAERLANFHRTYSQLNVKVVSLESIYQEFCSGKQDIGAIRNFMKYVYFNASDPAKRVKYLNLFGDASFDFKNRVSQFSNFVPIYHAKNGYSLGEGSFASDDYFTMMDDNEGDVDAGGIGVFPDIAVGRMIANSNLQADQLINKVIDYHDIKSYGSWRNNFVGIADDADVTGDASLQVKINTLIDKIALEKPFMNPTKILLDSYEQQTSSGGSRYPKARQDFFNAFEKGALVFNYLGHGGEDGLAQERIWESTDGRTLSNRYKYPLFITITCQFSRFDNPFRPTAGEYTYWNPNGGAISMITTVREINQGTGELFGDALAEHLFSYGSTQYPSIAEALRMTKEDPSAPRTNVVFYLGDPALMLAIPQPKIKLTKVNDMPITGPVDDFKALSYIKLTGEVTDENNNPLPAYKGELAVQIFDKTISRATRNNDNNAPAINFNILGETIFKGNASVNNGQFEFGFVVPRDIAIGTGKGRISFYSKRAQLFFDKTGYDTTITIGGTNFNAPVDNTPPKVKLYMNDLTFVNGSLTNQNPIFLAFLEDENGINTASGIGHDIQVVLDGNEANPYKLNDYYETELDNYKKGKLKFPFRNLAPGLHTLKFYAWDVYNNPITAELTFVVAGDGNITISNVLNYPNPFVNYTQFWFTHNKPFEPLEVQVQVLTISGKIVWTKNQTVTNDGFLSRDITWDGKDDFGDRIGKGVYIYKLTVKSLVTNTKAEKFEKLVIL